MPRNNPPSLPPPLPLAFSVRISFVSLTLFSFKYSPFSISDRPPSIASPGPHPPSLCNPNLSRIFCLLEVERERGVTSLLAASPFLPSSISLLLVSLTSEVTPFLLSSPSPSTKILLFSSMDSSNLTTTTTTNNTTSNYQEIPLSSFLNLPQPPPPPPPPPSSSSPSPSFFDPLPSFLPTFHQEPPSSSSSSSHPQSQQPQPPPRSNKKRSRASRRAPTTVLTTDTSNFRAMVQEFTGFPAPPFPASSSFPRPPRFDPLSASSSSSSPYFLSRPFPQKLPTPSSLAEAIAAATAANAAAYQFANAAGTIGIQNQNSLLSQPPPPPMPQQQQFGDHLASFVAVNSEGMQPHAQQHIRPSWAVHDPQDPDGHFHQQEKRQKTSGAADGGVVESWIHSSD